MKCLLSLIRYTSNTLKAKVRFKDFDETDVGDQLPMLATKRWRTRVKALVQTKRRRKRSLCSHVTLGRHMCCCPSRWLFPNNPFRAVESLVAVLSTDCSLFPRVTSHILSGLHRPPLHPREHVRSGTRSVDTYVPFSGYIALCPRFTAFVLFYGFFMGPFFGHHPRCHR